MIIDKIPLIVIPVLNRGDLLVRAIHSIDFPTDDLLIINNGRDESVADILNELQRDRLTYVERTIIISPRTNLGVSASWNLGIDHMNSHNMPFCMIAGSDIGFAPGDVEKFAAAFRPEIAMQFGNHDYSLFMLSKLAVEKIGKFDENFYPAYLEDCDYRHRMNIAGLPSRVIPGVSAQHGDDQFQNSCTILSDPVLMQLNSQTHGRNFEYYVRKWGGLNGQERFRSPFDNAGLPLSWWELEAEHRQANSIWPDL